MKKCYAKRILSLFMTVAMLLTMVPASVFATGTDASDDGVTVRYSVSYDENYVVGSETGEVMALKEITVPYFDLAEYGLEEYYFSSEEYGDDGDGAPGSDLEPGTPEYAEGKPTVLHLYIYALEVFEYGLDADEAGQGYLLEQDLMDTDAFTITGGAGSTFLNAYWGTSGGNTMYFRNYEYPLASEG